MTADRFDLEQQILECWRVVNDVELFVEKNSSPEQLKALAGYYEVKFQQLWDTFETMCHERQFVKPDVQSS